MELKQVERYSNIYQVDSFWKEFLKAINFKEPEDPERLKRLVDNNECIQWYYDRLDILDAHGRSCARRPKFEHLETKDGYALYSIRNTTSPLNPRIIFIFDDEDNVILLYPFLEKHDGDYEQAKTIAIKRAKLLDN